MDATTEPGRTPKALSTDDRDRYALGERIGEGAMGVVWRAIDRRLDREVALKMLHPRLLGGRFQAQLAAEARTMARVSHPNVVIVHDVGEREGCTYLAMELVRGPSLAQWLETPRPWPSIVEVARAVGLGLAAAHAAGVIHRDVKPANIVVADDGRPRIGDFGVAIAAADDESSDADDRAGSPAYWPPERLNGGHADARGDQFAFCATLWEALHGVRPFAGGTVAERCASMRAGRPKVTRVVPQWLTSVLERGLAYEPSERYESVDVLVDALRRPPPLREEPSEISLCIIQPLLRYMDEHAGPTSVADLAATIDIGVGELRTQTTWVSMRRLEQLLAAAASVIAADELDTAFSYRLHDSWGPLGVVFRGLSPARQAQLMSRSLQSVTSVGRGEVRITASDRFIAIYRSSIAETALVCRTRSAQFATLGAPSGLPPAQVVEHACIARGDDRCEYEVRWRADLWRARRIGPPLAIGAVAGLVTAGGLGELTSSFWHYVLSIGVGIAMACAAYGWRRLRSNTRRLAALSDGLVTVHSQTARARSASAASHPVRAEPLDERTTRHTE